MATLVPQLRAELKAARGPLLLQLQGLTDLKSVPNVSPQAQEVLEIEFTEHQARRTAIDDVLMALDRLDKTGYPASMASSVPREIGEELLAHRAAINAALGELEIDPEAVSANITFGSPELK
jgi:alkylated DNA repair dioxygenase AlkB